jgi:N-acetylglutamate synthase-like GNAT family acetyltransferase
VEAVRPATEEDLPRIAELARAAIAELTPMKGGAVWAAREARPEPVEESLKASLADGDTRMIVGTIDGVPVGYAAVHLEVLNDGSRLGVIDDIFVEEEAREVSVGETMMGDLVTWCQGQGCSGMDSMALPGHRSAKNFFEESGFTARKLVMHHRLGERRSR